MTDKPASMSHHPPGTPGRALLLQNIRGGEDANQRGKAHEISPDNLPDILIENGKIAAMGKNIAASDAKKIDGKNLWLAPGLIDLRTQAREPGFEHEETLASLAAAALAGGVTQLCCLPNTQPIIEDPSLVAMIRQALVHPQERPQVSTQIRPLVRPLVRPLAPPAPIIHPFAAMTKGLAGQELTEMGLLHQAGAIGFTDAPYAVASPLVLRRALSYTRFFDGLVMTHPEEPTLAPIGINGGVMNEGLIATRLGLSGRPVLAEIIQVERDLRLAEVTQGRLHIGPLTTAGSIEAVRQAKRRGVNVSCDTAPHYFLLTENAVEGYRTFAKVAPPLRSESDRQAVLAGLADGTIDAVTSDHAPRAADSKRLPFAQAAFGVVGIEILFASVLWLYHQNIVTLPKALALVTTQPAKILRLPLGDFSLGDLSQGDLPQGAAKNNYGIQVGQVADLVLFDLDQKWTVDPDKFRSKSKNSPMGGMIMTGRVEKTIKGGIIAFNREEK